MIKFIKILLSMNAMLLAIATVLYFVGCFVTWSMIDLNVGDFIAVRFAEVLLIAISFILSLDKDL